MKQIPLTQGKVALIDDEDYKHISQRKWYAAKIGKTYYAQHSIIRDGNQTTLMMHRQIMNPPSNLQCDHINGNGLDNRKSNLQSALYEDWLRKAEVALKKANG